MDRVGVCWYFPMEAMEEEAEIGVGTAGVECVVCLMSAHGQSSAPVWRVRREAEGRGQESRGKET